MSIESITLATIPRENPEPESHQMRSLTPGRLAPPASRRREVRVWHRGPWLRRSTRMSACRRCLRSYSSFLGNSYSKISDIRLPEFPACASSNLRRFPPLWKGNLDQSAAHQPEAQVRDRKAGPSLTLRVSVAPRTITGLCQRPGKKMWEKNMGENLLFPHLPFPCSPASRRGEPLARWAACGRVMKLGRVTR
jgi:hypothetical protein